MLSTFLIHPSGRQSSEAKTFLWLVDAKKKKHFWQRQLFSRHLARSKRFYFLGQTTVSQVCVSFSYPFVNFHFSFKIVKTWLNLWKLCRTVKNEFLLFWVLFHLLKLGNVEFTYRLIRLRCNKNCYRYVVPNEFYLLLKFANSCSVY